MKNILTLLFLMLATQVTVAQETSISHKVANSEFGLNTQISIGLNLTSIVLSDDKKEALKNIAKTTAQGFARNLVISSVDSFIESNVSQLDNLLGLAGENAMTGTASHIFAGIQLYGAGDQLSKAETGSEKSYAFAKTIGAAVSFVNPAIGGAIALGASASELLGAIVVKKDIEEIQALQAERIAYLEKHGDNIAKAILAQVYFIIDLESYYRSEVSSYEEYILKLSKMEICKGQININPQVMMTCFDLSLKAFYSLKNAVSALSTILNYESNSININELISNAYKDLGLNKTVKQLKADLVELEGFLVDIDKQLPEIIKSIVKAKLNYLLEEINTDNEKLFFPTLKCVTYLTENTVKIKKIELGIMLGKNKSLKEISLFFSQRQDLVNLTLGKSKLCLEEADPQDEFYSSLQAVSAQIESIQANELKKFLIKKLRDKE